MAAVVQRLRASVLGVRPFRLLFLGQAVSTVGDQIFPVAVTITVLNAGGGLTEVGLVLASRWLAVVLFALVGGVWADRLPRTLVMRAADVFRGLAVLGLAVLPTAPPIWVLALLVFLVGGGEAFFRPAETALLPSILPADRLAAANGLIVISYRTASVVGPGLGALLVSVAGGTRGAFVVNALTFGVSLVCLTLLREPPREQVPREDRPGMLREILEGLAEVRRRPWVAAVLVLASVWLMLVLGPETVLLPVIGRQEFGSDHVYAASLALFAAGGVVGAVLALRIRPRLPGLVGALGWLPFTLVLAALAWPVAPWVFYVSYFLAGLGFEPFNIYWQTALQREIPGETLARVSSLDWMASLALLPVGMALTGPAVAAVGLGPVLLVAAVVNVAGTLLILAVPGVKELATPAPRGESVSRRR
jgi:DHA3 family tetracycline resistance protein-like MFS transporter